MSGSTLGLSDNLMWTGTIRMLAIFCTKGMCCMWELLFTAPSHKINTSVLVFGVSMGAVVWSVIIQLKFMIPVKQVEVLSVLSGHHPFVRTASSLMSQTACSISFLSFITCHPFLLILWCLLTTLNDITFNLNMNALLKLVDTRKLECRNWLADDQDRGRWRHLL